MKKFLLDSAIVAVVSAAALFIGYQIGHRYTIGVETELHSCEVDRNDREQMLRFAIDRMDTMQEKLNHIPHGW